MAAHRTRIRWAVALATAAAVTVGMVGGAAPASAELVRIGDRLLVPATYPVPGGTQQPQSGGQTGPDGNVWLTMGTDVIRFAADGTSARFTGYPSGTATSMSLLTPYDGGFLYRVTSSDAAIHWMQITTAGQVDEVVPPNGMSASDLILVAPSPEGSAWFVVKPVAPAPPTVALRLTAGAATSYTAPARIRAILPTADGGAYAETASGLVRFAPDGSSTVVTSVNGYWIDDPWPGADGSLWFVGQSQSTYRTVLGMVRSDGTLDVVEPTGVTSPAPVARTAQAVTWITGQDPSSPSTRVAYAGASPSSLRRIPLPIGASYTTLDNGRLWLAAYDAPASGNATIVSTGSAGDVRVEGSIEDLSVSQVSAAPDGTIWVGGTRPSAPDSFSSRVVAIRPDRSLLFGSLSRALGAGPDFTSDGSPWFSAPGGLTTFRSATADRIGGPTRYDAAATIAKAAFPSGAPIAYVASGQNFPDALSAGPVAAADGGPLLLTLPDSLPTVTRETLTALAPRQIVVIGGTASVSNVVLEQLRKVAVDVTRVAGVDRYSVSKGLVGTHQRPGKPLFVATGAGYADAVTAGAAAARAGGQLLLVPGDRANLPAGYDSFIAGLAPSSIAVVGGPASVSDGILAELSGFATATRYGGADRYAVSAAVVSAFGSPSAHVYVTTGQNFPDAIAAAPLAGHSDAALVSVPGTCVPTGTLAAIDAARPAKITVLGGSDSVGADASWLAAC